MLKFDNKLVLLHGATIELKNWIHQVIVNKFNQKHKGDSMECEVLKKADVKALCGNISDSTFFRWQKNGIIPPGHSAPGMSARWFKSEIIEALQAVQKR